MPATVREVDQMWRRFLGIVLLAAAGAVMGSAASLAITSSTLGAARVATPRCTVAGLTVFHTLVGSTVSSVTVGGVPSTCAGATLQVTVNNGSVNSAGSIVIPVGGGSVTAILGVATTVTAAQQTDLVLIGP